MDLGKQILFDLFIMFVAARLGGWWFSRFGQPAVLGELIAGVVIGPHTLGLVGRASPELVTVFGSADAAEAALRGAYYTVAELGLIFLLFYIGLEIRVRDIFAVGQRSLAVAVLGIALPFVLAYGYVRFTGRDDVQALFVGAALVATSTAITARTLRDLGLLHAREAQIILGAAVIDDVLSLLILGVVAGLGGAGRSSPTDIAFLFAEALAFVVFVALVGAGVIRRYGPRLRVSKEPNAPFVVAVGTCLGLSVLASQVGLSPIVGAFLAGMVMAEAKAHLNIERSAQPVYELLAPFFFVVVGVDVDLGVLADPELLSLAAALTFLAVIGKLVGCGLGAWGLGRRRTALVGWGMVPRGEVGLAAVSLGRALNAVPEAIFSIVVVVSLLTTVIVPPILARLVSGVAADRRRSRPACGEPWDEESVLGQLASQSTEAARS